MKEIPKKNYVIAFLIALATVGLCFYLRNWYQMSELTSASKNLLAEKLPEIKLEEMNTYLQENPNIIIYISSSIDENNKDFEKKIYQYIVRSEKSYEFVYLNKDEVTDEEIIQFQKEYGIENIKNMNMVYIPNFYVIQDGKIINYYNQNGRISDKDAINFLKSVGV